MNEPDWKGALGEAFEEALGYLEGLPSRPLSGYPALPNYVLHWVSRYLSNRWSPGRW
jgi:hypothetical protein